MKIISTLQENKHICIRFNNDCRVIANEVEIETAIKGNANGAPVMILDSTMLRISYSDITIYPCVRSRLKTANGVEQVPITAMYICCNTKRLFARIREGVHRLGVGIYYELDTNSFSFSRCEDHQPKTELNFCQIIRHPEFNEYAKKSLFFAVKNKVGFKSYLDHSPLSGLAKMNFRLNGSCHEEKREHRTPHIIALRRELSLYLQKGFTIGTDGINTPSFSFWGGGYNGGIIFHGPYDNFGSGGAPTFAVTLTPTHGWSVHT